VRLASQSRCGDQVSQQDGKPTYQRQAPDARRGDFLARQNARFGKGLAERGQVDVAFFDGDKSRLFGGFGKDEEMIRVNIQLIGSR